LRGGGTGQCHQMPQGEGRGLAKVSRDIFFQNFEPNFCLFAFFFHVTRGGSKIGQKSVTYYLNGAQ